MNNKILNKYRIINTNEKGKIIAEYNRDKYIIEVAPKGEQNNMLSYRQKI
nr:hypothetical protein [uncultured Campylobacter sp.]